MIASGGQPPIMSQFLFRDMCNMMGIADKVVTRNAFDCLFYSTNFETEQDAFNTEHKLARHEFFEILYRISLEIYVKTGEVVENCTQSLQHLINDHVFKILNNKMLPKLSAFRENDLWTYEVNKLYQSNLDSLKGVFEQMFEMKNPPQKLVPCNLKKSSTMVTIDQVYCYFDEHSIKRTTGQLA